MTTKTKVITLLIALLIVTNIHIVPSTYIGELKPRGIYVTYDTGLLLNTEGDGILLTEYTDDYYNYIYYNPQRFTVGDRITTLCLYNPFTIWGDDIVARIDF